AFILDGGVIFEKNIKFPLINKINIEMTIKEFIDTYQITIIISSIVLVITSITFIWNWQSRRRTRPVVQYMTLQGKNYFNVTIYNNASYNLRIHKAYKGRIWFFRKLMSIGLSDVNNESHSEMFAMQKLGNIFESGG